MIARTRSQRSFGAPSRLVVLAFVAAVAAGALLFALPVARTDGAWHLDLRSLFLATSDSSFVDGQLLRVDGGVDI